ncbi:hypothetical protein [Streptomyces sp. NRRL F-4474]|uniref:hypothetical protein n=1 Tax=Streptomyces sp. NRRL F-4474 TaxID=1463851 RepID=UPI00131E000E|nr:hypothetical protein [Streptomyces sp. NRRL F-4474]
MDQTRQKVLEAVAQGTMGLREENRELRRRQERMLTDLAEARSGLEALSRRLEGSVQAVPLVKTEEASPLAAVAPASAESEVQPPAGPDAAEPEVLGEPAELLERSDGKEPRVLEEVRNAHGHGNTAGKPETAPHLTPVAETVQEPAQVDQEDQRAHLRCLLSAAAIASATLICHRETWDFIAEHTTGHTHFRLPERIDDADGGRVETSLSGRSLLAVLTMMWKVTREREGDATSPGGGEQDLATWALAAAVYRRTALAVDRVTHLAEKENGPALIVLDDRSTRTTGPDPGAAAA